MALNIGREISRLKDMTVAELRKRHIEVFGERTRSGHKAYLLKRIAWRLQAEAEGDISQRARRRARELANDAALRTTPPKRDDSDSQPDVTASAPAYPNHDPRVPMPGSILHRRYKGRDIMVKVLPEGFEYEGEIYRSLSATARAVTGKHWNGYHFFQLGKKETTT